MSESCDRCGHVTDHPEWQEVCFCHLYDEIERLRADKKRLNWLESHHYVEATSGVPDGQGRIGLEWRACEGPPLRKAIDEKVKDAERLATA